MISATFIFKQKANDEKFRKLDEAIETSVSQDPEFLGKDVWENQENGRSAVVYYFSSHKGLEALRKFSSHKEAKSEYRNWYEGYHVIIAEVTASYGDGWLNHPTKNIRNS